MPIKWSALRVIEAADMIEGHINKAVEPLECAREVAKAALEISNLPLYVDQHFRGLLDDIERATGRLKGRLQSIRDDVPKEALEGEKKSAEYGERQSLV